MTEKHQDENIRLPTYKKRRAGQAPHEVTEASKRVVTIAAGCRMRMTLIADLLGISCDTLHKHYFQEIKNGKSLCDLKVADAMFKNIAKGDSALIKYYMSNQMGFEEKTSLTVNVEKPTDDDRENLKRFIDQQIKERMEQTNDKGRTADAGTGGDSKDGERLGSEVGRGPEQGQGD